MDEQEQKALAQSLLAPSGLTIGLSEAGNYVIEGEHCHIGFNEDESLGSVLEVAAMIAADREHKAS